MGKVKPFLLVGDAVSSGTGLGRIAGMIAKGIHDDLQDCYRLAAAGYGSPGSRHFGFQQYNLEGMKDWVLPTLPEIWDDWAGEERGVVLCVWDPSRLSWLAQPELFSELLEDFPGLARWLQKPNFEKWLYCPLDAEGPDGKLTFPLMKTLLGFDRIIAYTEWGAEVIRRTIGSEEANKRHLTALPHGVDGEIFYELPRQACRKAFFTRTGAAMLTNRRPGPLEDDECLIAIAGTNQARKDWALGIETAALLAKDRKVRLWAHTDRLEQAAWSIPALLVDYGMVDRTVISLGHISDENMAVGYSASDLTIGIAPEGFGFVPVESVFCGTPCVAGSYAATGEVLRGYGNLLVEPVAFRYEGVFSSRRPVYSAQQFVAAARDAIGKRINRPGEYDWENVWPRWEEYLRKAREEFGE